MAFPNMKAVSPREVLVLSKDETLILIVTAVAVLLDPIDSAISGWEWPCKSELFRSSSPFNI